MGGTKKKSLSRKQKKQMKRKQILGNSKKGDVKESNPEEFMEEAPKAGSKPTDKQQNTVSKPADKQPKNEEKPKKEEEQSPKEPPVKKSALEEEKKDDAPQAVSDFAAQPSDFAAPPSDFAVSLSEIAAPSVIGGDPNCSSIGTDPVPFDPNVTVIGCVNTDGKDEPKDDQKEEEDDDDAFYNNPMVPTIPGRFFMKSLGDDDDDDDLLQITVPPVGAAQPKKEEKKKERKERKPSTAGCIGGHYESSGMRPYQEDRNVVDDTTGFYAVFDGHGGDKASHYCEKHMKDYVFDSMDSVSDEFNVEEMKKAFTEAFVELDKKFLDKRVDDGSTACVAYVANDGKQSKLYVANAGDSRAIVACADGSVVEMSEDHKPDLPSERKRIEAAYHEVIVIQDVYQGKRIKIARVDGMLAVARAIGDGSLKDDMSQPEKSAVTSIPDVRELVLDKEKHKYLIIACDGIWDVYKNEEVAGIVVEELGTDKSKPVDTAELDRVAKVVVDGAIFRGSMDNCTVVIVAL